MDHSIFIKELPRPQPRQPVQKEYVATPSPPDTARLVQMAKVQTIANNFLDKLKEVGIDIDASKKAATLNKIAEVIEEMKINQDS